MSTPNKPRQSGIPTPGKSTGIPTPRPRSASSANNGGPVVDDEFANRAFQDALKSNDPAQHRTSRVEASLAQSGRRSVAGVRPPSVASGSTPASRARTPSARPASRQSDVLTRSASRAGREFDLGDTVRIESLGFEGTLRFLGEIDGKPGIWAGVELAGGFSGRGKNDGRVGDTQYFICDPKCGVFVATAKLSAPSYTRPSSVASSYGGRNTPSFQSGRVTPGANGRVTPSSMMSTGRVTPAARGRATPGASSGRVTPGMTPSVARSRTVSKPVPTVSSSSSISTPGGAITSGSRASKYLGMTAKQLNSRDSPTAAGRVSMGSPTRSATGLSSPTRGSPFTTPKAVSNGRISGVGMGTPSGTPSKTRPAISTPRARIPSAIAMPPPPSPMSARSVSLNESVSGGQPLRSARSRDNMGGSPDLEFNQRAIQDKLAQIQGMGFGNGKASPRPDSSASARGSLAGDHQIQVLQSRLDAVEYENERLRAEVADAAEAAASVPLPTAVSPLPEVPIAIALEPLGTSEEDTRRLAELQAERDEALAREGELTSQLATIQQALNERQSQIDTLELEVSAARISSQKVTADVEQHAKTLNSQLEASVAKLEELQSAMQIKEEVESENNTLIDNKMAEVVSLEAEVQKAYAELESERRELGGQVGELRQAGQETIALYEERLSAAESQRYELEDRITSLEAQRAAPAPPATLTTRQASSAAEIDNETLRDQITHLQKKISSLEDSLEDMQAAAEKEEAVFQSRIKRFREKEDASKAELEAGRKEVERVAKDEASARQKIEEIEEALRESAVALEDAQGEIEALRSENVGLGSMTTTNPGEIAVRTAEISQRAATERSRLQEEIASLQDMLEASRASERAALEHTADGSSDELQDTIQRLEARNAEVEDLIDDRDASLAQERKAGSELRQTLDQKIAELDVLKKKANREANVQNPTVTSPITSSTPTRYDPTTREEITGLKHIVQGLQKECAAAEQRIKLLESENKLLASEADQLRQEIATLEENFEQSIMNDENALNSSDEHDSSDSQRALKDQKNKLETELEQLRKRLTETEMKNARAAHDFNKEIGELEVLVESKIYREDELEQEVEKLKEKLARSQRKSSKTSTDGPRPSGASTSSRDSQTSTTLLGDICEICEQPGHDIFNCDLLKADVSPTTQPSRMSNGANDPDLFCEDCEGHGHTAANCPSSLDVF